MPLEIVRREIIPNLATGGLILGIGLHRAAFYSNAPDKLMEQINVKYKRVEIDIPSKLVRAMLAAARALEIDLVSGASPIRMDALWSKMPTPIGPWWDS